MLQGPYLLDRNCTSLLKTPGSPDTQSAFDKNSNMATMHRHTPVNEKRRSSRSRSASPDSSDGHRKRSKFTLSENSAFMKVNMRKEKEEIQPTTSGHIPYPMLSLEAYQQHLRASSFRDRAAPSEKREAMIKDYPPFAMYPHPLSMMTGRDSIRPGSDNPLLMMGQDPRIPLSSQWMKHTNSLQAPLSPYLYHPAMSPFMHPYLSFAPSLYNHTNSSMPTPVPLPTDLRKRMNTSKEISSTTDDKPEKDEAARSERIPSASDLERYDDSVRREQHHFSDISDEDCEMPLHEEDSDEEIDVTDSDTEDNKSPKITSSDELRRRLSSPTAESTPHNHHHRYNHRRINTSVTSTENSSPETSPSISVQHLFPSSAVHLSPTSDHHLPSTFCLPPPPFRNSPSGVLPPTLRFPGSSVPGMMTPAMFPYPLGGRRPKDPSKPPPTKKYKCDLCSKAFSRSNTLVTHRRIHTGEKPFKCEICSRAFRQPGNLTRHRLTHTTVKPYVCPVCHKAFNRASNLQTHMRTHSNIKPFGCPYCGKGFEQKVDLKIHMYTHGANPDQHL